MKTCKLYQNRILDKNWFSDHINECAECSDYFNSMTKMSQRENNQTKPSDYFTEMNQTVIKRLKSGSVHKPNSIWLTASSIAAVFLVAFLFSVSPSERNDGNQDIILSQVEMVNYFQLNNYHQLLDQSDNSDVSGLLETIYADEEIPAAESESEIDLQELDNLFQSEFKIRSEKNI